MARALESRLGKLEAARQPPKAVFFLVWGRDEAEIEQAVASARAGGSLGRGDTIVRALWTGHNGMPARRGIRMNGYEVGAGS